MYRPSSNRGQNNQKHTNRNVNKKILTASKTLIIAIGGLFLVGASLVVFFIAISVLYITVFTLTTVSIPAMYAGLFFGEGAGFLANLLLASISGLMAGLCIGLIRRWFKVKNRISESFMSSVINHKLFSIDKMFIPSVMISMTVGLIIGSIAGAGSSIELAQATLDGYTAAISVVGLVGVGGSGGFPILSYGLILLILLIILLQTIILGAILGSLAYVIIGMIMGAAKGSTKGLFKTSIEMRTKNDSDEKPLVIMFKNAYRGLFEGGIAGSVVGLIHGSIKIYELDRGKGLNVTYVATAVIFFIFVVFSLIKWANEAVSRSTRPVSDSYSNYGPYLGGRSFDSKEEIDSAPSVQINCPFCGKEMKIDANEIKVYASEGCIKCKHCNDIIIDKNGMRSP